MSIDYFKIRIKLFRKSEIYKMYFVTDPVKEVKVVKEILEMVG